MFSMLRDYILNYLGIIGENRGYEQLAYHHCDYHLFKRGCAQRKAGGSYGI